MSSRSDRIDLTGRQPISPEVNIRNRWCPTGNIVTRTQFAVVVTLWSRRDLSHGDLCVLTAMNRATLGGVVERLVRSRLAVIRIDAAGARRRCIRKKVARLRSVSAMISDEILTNSNETEDALLIGLLSKMMAKRRDHGVPPVDRRSAHRGGPSVGSPLK